MKRLVLFLFFFLAIGCSARLKRDYGKVAHKKPSVVLPNHACKQKDESLDAFLPRFTTEPNFQFSRIVFPLVYRGGTYPTNLFSIDLMSENTINNLVFPLIYSKEDLDRANLRQSIVLLQEGRYAEVTQEQGTDSDDISLLFKFRNIQGCWFLEEVHDRSW